MSTTSAPVRVTFTTVEPTGTVDYSLENFCLEAFRFPELDQLYDDMPGRFTEPRAAAFVSAVTDEAIKEVTDQVIELLLQAIRKRLPATWEGEELYR